MLPAKAEAQENQKHWGLSPAYDLTPSPVVSQEHRDLALEWGDEGRFAKTKNILSQHARFLLGKDEAEKIIADMREPSLVRHGSGVWRVGERCGDDAERIYLPRPFSVEIRRPWFTGGNYMVPSACSHLPQSAVPPRGR
jgi:hypothetical protein